MRSVECYIGRMAMEVGIASCNNLSRYLERVATARKSS